MMRFILFQIFILLSSLLHAQQKKVMVMEIKSEIDPRMKRYVELAVKHAEEIKADIVIIEMDTYGGVLTDAKEIVDQLMSLKKPVWVFINSDAASAGALISIACDSIYMSPGASIGAATVVTSTGEKAPDKYQSYMRSIMRSTAEEHGRDPRIAEGMVDESIAIDSITSEGKIITFSTSEAIKYGYCEGKVSSIEEILKKNKIENYELEKYSLGTTETIIAFFLNPFISGILIMLIIGGLYFELQTPGVGFPGAAALLAIILYLVPYYLNGLAQNWEIIALFIGIFLIAIEVFVIPGFGVAGITGISLTLTSLVLIMINNDFFNFDFVPFNEILYATAATIGGIGGGFFLLFAGGSRLAKSKFFDKVSSPLTQEKALGYTVKIFKETMVGKKGKTYTVLRPSGKIMIENTLYDAFSQGEYIEKGVEIEVVSEEGNSLIVKIISG